MARRACLVLRVNECAKPVWPPCTFFLKDNGRLVRPRWSWADGFSSCNFAVRLWAACLDVGCLKEPLAISCAEINSSSRSLASSLPCTSSLSWSQDCLWPPSDCFRCFWAGRGSSLFKAAILVWSFAVPSHVLADQPLQPLMINVAVVNIFNGIGGAFRLYDVLGLVPAARISIEIDRVANRVTRCAWPGVYEFRAVLEISKETIIAWANTYGFVDEVHIFAGSPCIHLSSVRAFRRSLQGPGSRLFWVLLDIITWLQEVFGSFARVKFCVENVSSMDEAARAEISEALGIQPVKLDPSDSLPFNRPRLAWCSVPLYEMEGLTLAPERDYIRAWVETPQFKLHNGSGQVAQKGTCASQRSWRVFVGPHLHRCPQDSTALQKLRELCGEKTITGSLRISSPLNIFSPPDISPLGCWIVLKERSCWASGQVIPVLAGLPPRSNRIHGTTDRRDSLCGDSFCILSFAIMASAMCAELVPRMTPAPISMRLGLAPGASAHPSVRIPMSRWLSYGGDASREPSPVELVQSLGLSVNRARCDVRISSGSLMGKRMAHASVKALWWQWKHLFSVRRSSHSHINF